MGKASKLKAIRRIAGQLPGIVTPVMKTTLITGKEARQHGLKLPDGSKPSLNGMYNAKKEVQQHVDHAKIMKREYNKGGAAAVGKYLNYLTGFVASKRPVATV